MEQFEIGAVAKLTGLSIHVIRVWEKRYQAVIAQRTDTGRRLYTQHDINRLSLLKQCTDNGRSISAIAQLPEQKLKDYLNQIQQSRAIKPKEQTQIAVLGQQKLFIQIKELKDKLRLNCLAFAHTLDGLQDELAGQAVDLLVIEQAILNEHLVHRLVELIERLRPLHTVLIYHYSRSLDLSLLRRLNTNLIKAPYNIEELYQSLRLSQQWAATIDRLPDALDSESVPAPLFTEAKLAQVALMGSRIECECPQHLVDIVSSLNAFEYYSLSCQQKDNKDAALHAKMHQTTATARSIMERLLEQVLQSEQVKD